MPLNSYRFVVFAAVTIALYNLVPSRHRLLLLLFASVLFCADSSIRHLFVLSFITAATYAAAIIAATHRGRLVLAASIVAVTIPLIVFKYYAFLTRLATQFLGLDSGAVVDVALPLGISFVTFQAIAYIVDVHRGTTRAEPRVDVVALHLAFFPKLLAGPIERAGDLIPQLKTLVRSTASNVYSGLKFALWGFFCKLVVADNLGSIVDAALKAPQQESGATLSIVFALYAFEIYFDFLGYTSIAIGVARCFNIRLNPNFNAPYAATSLRDFWRRWHISLSSWFRDYVYIPLGGNTTRGLTRASHLLLVFLLSGLWHGAALHFAAWGVFHGAAYWTEEQLRKSVRWPIWSSAGVLHLFRVSGQRVLTFGIVTLGWVFFRLADPWSIRVTLEKMAFLNHDVPYASLNSILIRTDSRWFFMILLSAVFLDSSRAFRAALDRVPESSAHVIGELAYVNWMVVTLVLLGDVGVRDFTYFAF